MSEKEWPSWLHPASTRVMVAQPNCGCCPQLADDIRKVIESLKKALPRPDGAPAAA